MAHVTLPEVQQWLEQTKLTLADVDASLEETASAVVFSRLGFLYTTSGWTDENNTPTIVRKIISMLIAGWTYQRQYSEDATDTDNYGTMLEARANMLIDGILAGAIDLPDEVVTEDTHGQPVFFPTDASTEEAEEPYFKMGMTF